MGMFDPMWSDVDRTRQGEPYVVSSDGWGWFAILIMLAMPFFLMGIILLNFAETVCAHPYISAGLYFLFALIFSFIFYGRGNKKCKGLGVVASVITLLPFAMVEGLYMIPYILQNSLFSAVFEWIIVTVFIGAITFFLLAISNILGNGLIHLIIAIAFCVIVFLILNNMFDSSSEINWDVIRTLYIRQ